jgi:hypothetical protein
LVAECFFENFGKKGFFFKKIGKVKNNLIYAKITQVLGTHGAMFVAIILI